VLFVPQLISLCEFELAGYSELHRPESAPDLTSDEDEWYFFGGFNTYVGNLTTTTIPEYLQARWPSGNVSNQEGQTVQAINGTLDIGTDMTFPEYQSQINGTLASNGTSLILQAHGVQLN
jgi:hypothetical protein